MPVFGDPDGHGRYGVLDLTVEGRRATPRVTEETAEYLRGLSVGEWVRAVEALRAEGVTVREIAAATGMKEHTAYQRLHRHRER